MDSLLKHMVDMTGHRDHAMLDISVIAAVQELAGACQTRILGIATVSGKQVLRARASIRKGSIPLLEDPLDGTPGEPLAAWPELMRCLAERHPSAESAGGDGM